MSGKTELTEIYNSSFVKNLFDEMSKTYGTVNVISSFGFCKIWRKKCVNQVAIESGMTVCDLMTGMGECWESIDKKVNRETRLLALDFSEAMCRQAKKNSAFLKHGKVEIFEEDVLNNSIPSASADCVISSFGLKTFSDEQKQRLAIEIKRILKPNGSFSLLEISVPPNKILRLPYMFYLKRVIPAIGKLFMGNPENYRMLGIYTEQFGNCRKMSEFLQNAGLEVEYKSFFFGCASGLRGKNRI